MTNRYTGGVISATAPTVSQSSASGVWNLEEAQYYQKAGLWPPGSGADPYFQNTTLLLHGDGTNGAQNNSFVDSSVNNFTITRNGNTTQGAFNPYVGPGNWSNFYATTQSGWTTPTNSASTIIGSAFNATVTFTAEAWIYPLSRHSGGGAVLGYVVGQMQLAGSAVDWSFGPDSNGNLVLFWYAGSDQISKGGSVIPLNTWTHIALSVSNGVIRMFVNGVQETLTGLTSTTASSTTTNYISSGGYLYAGTTWQGFNGYISNLRVIGKRAVYTANFTPSTTPLIATTDTTLLVNNQNRFNDISGAGWPLTRVGGVQVSKFAPFTFYQTNPTSYSGYFDGAGDYLSAPTSSVQLGAQEFTFETWVYFSEVANDRTLIYWNGNTSGNAALHVRTISARWALWISQNGSSWAIQQNALGSTIVAGQWYHVAVVRAGNNVRMFVNGTDITSGGYTLSGSLMTTYTLNQIGVYNSAFYYMQGSLSNFRIVSGTAAYTANFTPSTSALTTTTTVPSNQSNSVSFDGSGDYLTFPQASLQFGTSDFTVEAWVYFSAIVTDQYVFNYASSGPTHVGINYYSGAWRIGGFNSYLITGGSASTGQWYHVAMVRSANNLRAYINGTQIGSAVSVSGVTFSASGIGYIGAYYLSGSNLNGFVSNLRITNGQALYTSNFTPSTSPLTTTSQGATAANVSLLTCQDRLLEDNSLNLFAITAVGNARPTSANPFVATNGIGGTSYSGFFDGTGDYLSGPASNSSIWPGSGNFTIEYWLYLPSNPGSTTYYNHFSYGTSGSVLRVFNTGATSKVEVFSGTSVILNPAWPGVGQWNHFALVRNGTTLTLYINGVAAQSVTNSTNFSTGTLTIGGEGASNSLLGYVSNFRIVKGTAVYTSNFSPSTTPLVAVSGTQLLTCQSTTFIDNSTNAFPISVSGNAVTNAFNPYSGATTLLTCQSTQFIDNSAIPVTITANGNATPKLANPFTDTVTGPTSYTGSTYAGSAYFDGSGDYLTLTGSSNLAFGSNNFTIEVWIYPTLAADRMIYDGRPNSSLGPYPTLYIGSTNQVIYYTTGANRIAGGTIQYYAWNHIALVRSSGTTRLYLNGALLGSFADAISYANGTARPIIGADGGNVATLNMLGYLSNLRVVNGTAVYTGPFVPPAAPATAVSGTQLLVNGTNAGIFDNTTVNDLETIGSAQVSTSVVKYGTGSMSFNGLSDALIMPSQPAIAFNTGDFTVEGWVYFAGAPASTFHSLYSTLVQLASPGDHGVLIRASTTKLIAILQADNATTLTLTSTNNVTTGQWYHFALTRSGTTARLFLNGTLEASGTSSVNFYETAQALGRVYATSTGTTQYLNGYLDDVRVTKGVARYTANFTPPAAAFPNF